MPPKVVVADQKSVDLEIETDVLGEIDATVTTTDAVTDTELIQAVDGADGLIVDGYRQVTKRVISSLPNLQVIVRAGIGIDNIDLEAATVNGVQVVNVPDAATDDVAIHALALLFTCARQIPLYQKSIKEGKWDWEQGAPLYTLSGKTLGLLGFGNIAKSLSKRVSSLDMDVITCDRSVTTEELSEYGVREVTFEELLTRADFLSIHLPLTEDTRHLIGKDEFCSMKESAIMINTARGPIVDENALYEAIRNDEISGAGLDVLSEEPPKNSTLISLDEVVVTPHMAWYTEDTINRVRETAVTEVLRVLQGDSPQNPMNIPSQQDAMADTD